MPKTYIRVHIKSSTEDLSETVPAIIQDGSILYKTKDNTTTKYSYKENILSRENENIKMEYIFNPTKETTGKILIKDLKSYINVRIKTHKLIVENNEIEIEFNVEEDHFFYKIEETR